MTANYLQRPLLTPQQTTNKYYGWVVVVWRTDYAFSATGQGCHTWNYKYPSYYC